MSSGKRPMNEVIADDIRNKVESGVYPPGDQLPAQADLADWHGVSEIVIRKALDRLKREGLVVGRSGSGTYVRERPPMRRHGPDRYARPTWMGGKAILEAEAAEQGHVARQIVRELAEVPAPAVVAERLGIAAGTTVWVRRRTTLVDDRPNQLADSYYPLDVAEAAPQIREENTGPGGGFARLFEAGFDPTRGNERIVPRQAPTEDEIRLLELPPGMPVMDLTRTIFDQHDRPVEVMLAVMNAEMVEFNYDFVIPD